MLATVIAEKYGKELVDLLPEDAEVSTTDTDDVFESTIVWREPASFTDRTLELLNQLTRYGHPHPTLDILLKLSTEPEHPWNAELLHRNLLDKEIAERDQFWSTDLALAYASEEDEGYESTVRTLIEWASFGDIEEVEEERIRLCSYYSDVVSHDVQSKSEGQINEGLGKNLVTIPLPPDRPVAGLPCGQRSLCSRTSIFCCLWSHMQHDRPAYYFSDCSFGLRSRIQGRQATATYPAQGLCPRCSGMRPRSGICFPKE